MFVRLFSVCLICSRWGSVEGFWQRMGCIIKQCHSWTSPHGSAPWVKNKHSVPLLMETKIKPMVSILNVCILLHYNSCRIHPRYVEVLWSIPISRGLYGLIDACLKCASFSLSGRTLARRLVCSRLVQTNPIVSPKCARPQYPGDQLACRDFDWQPLEECRETEINNLCSGKSRRSYSLWWSSSLERREYGAC